MYEFYHRDILQCIRALYGDPELAEFLIHTPEKHFTGPDKETRMYSEMHTGKWWWTRQVWLLFLTTTHSANICGIGGT